ncbi:Mannosyl-oligosaccharide glucosidase GCS1 [Cryptotermes secundus]|uniref:Mannosyl-oligosaccharide glucosidase n=2 Tax=Cryptotermes secundus TaxID=105785 RepID=A0A2J7RH57_9NEOP|nr:mannosyl-oligosaccharide glucosidase isoform X3 [Cryptotermes secundus]XP_023727934.1 mannosyl-oligosaccharide glucosidase isoform X3 [Cryptotermes secundus]XP_023727935.1 mannosyl-oligosaccharide glucosidase isoform X3 [Cryptotermes secundus]PNF40173.1 Mannosyl-oligosaccharide glucosidase GCS1 [Cryptotermes secundus]PNF40174.1 Mannosyl-oligosaccharide glucosidase GCS1 [Cryptotermes secundus]
MARQRKPLPVDHINPKYLKKSQTQSRKEGRIFLYWKQGMAFICLLIAGIIAYMGYLETRVNTPFDEQKVVIKSGLDVPDRYWGSYRPGLYFGMKTRDPYSLVSGLMWYFPRQLRPDGGGIRHWCEDGDNLGRYGWLEHDGRNFGLQEIEDGPFNITVSFVKRPGGNHGGDWTARISVTTQYSHLQDELISFLLYSATEEKTKGWIKPEHFQNGLFMGVTGETEGLGAFALKLYNHSGQVESESYLSTVTQGLHVLKETVFSSLRLVTDHQKGNRRHIVLPGELLPSSGPDGKRAEPNFVVTQVTARVPFELDFVFESGSFMDRPGSLTGDAYTRELSWHRSNFHNRFEETFKLQTKGYNTDEVVFAKTAFSNLLGGVGYFYGASRVESPYTRGPVPYWKAPLYSAVPSRSFFPRGFLWDEGFHGLLISSWDLDIELDIISHWFDLMNVEGWIPREQILGQEALSKVPEQFVTQRNSNANPPTFFLTFHFILQNFVDKLTENGGHLGTLERLYPRLQAWFDWFNVTQIGDMSGTYRWRGRDATTNRELNPITLTSGLDDYPRASHPNVDERHVDLRCWIALAASTMSEIARLLNLNGQKYSNTYGYLADNNLLDELHWSPRTQAYSDFGLHTDAVVLKRPPPPRSPPTGYQMPQNPDKIRVVLKDPELRFVDSTFGYVSLFPFLLQILEPDSPKLNKILDDLKSTELLWTNYGLRSLAKTAPLYMKRNTEHDPPYWRGPIWINLNYMVVRALNHYSKADGPYSKKAKTVYQELRQNLIKNIIKEYKRTGYIWEQYNDKTGEGQRSRPFTGWSSLVVLMMAEIY